MSGVQKDSINRHIQGFGDAQIATLAFYIIRIKKIIILKFYK